MESHIRQNLATGEWIIIAPQRGKRPQQFRHNAVGMDMMATHDEDCPFCRGNEDLLPDIIMELPKSGGEGWQTRVVPNKFPALAPVGDNSRRTEGIYLNMPAHGKHEVIIESPRHERDMGEMSAREITTVVETYYRRYQALMGESNNLLAVIFRNHGEKAGTSLRHPHSQLAVTSLIPRHVRARQAYAREYFDQSGRCVFCDILAFEGELGKRVIWDEGAFLAFVPYAAEAPFEIWILPRRHQAEFGEINKGERVGLASALKGCLSRLYQKLNDPDYNYVFHSASPYQRAAPHLHWFVQIRPRLTIQAGFEIGSGMTINPSIPEEDARFLLG